MGNFQDIKTRFQVAWLYEGKLHTDDKAVTAFFRNEAKKLFKGDANSKRGYHLRLELGTSNDEAMTNVKKVVDTVLKPEDYKINVVEPGDFKNGARSGQFFTYEVELLNNVELDRKESAQAGTKIIFANNQAAKGSIPAKALTPTGLKLKEDYDYTPSNLIYDLKLQIQKQYGSKQGVAFPLLGLVDVVSAYKGKNFFNSPLEITDIDDYITMDEELVEAMLALDPTDLAVIGKDFGEVLGGIYLMNICKYTDGVLFPSGNNPIVDLYFDGYGISSKYKKGAAPTLSGVIKNLKEEQLTTPDEVELNKIFTILKDYGVTDSYIEVAKMLNSPAITKLAEMYGVKPADITESFLQTEAQRMQAEGIDPLVALKDFYTIMGRKPSGTIDWKRFKTDKSWHGVFTGPLSYHVIDLLNGGIGSTKYLDALNTIMRKVEVKQLYLDFLLKKDMIEFKMRAFTNPKAKFEFEAPNQSVYNPSNGKLGFKMK
jgi:hypothetical protein